ncbi:AraC family transcriptional regulator ligand-binding domain-containing protein [Spongiibacter sp. KMU-158]|uniref:AraC family transcriptional regulator ligand-binding domain-containing protein n=1 Tax=Spongiibacter pelagi TaxID=2760804 RepID=A0A927GVV1_9GAMM|nr:AraC family transcriptional regulator [Spongiibacter pelagi]MBD2858785.1 AraC family transcriptional regulator ligand-binding domain-containing protein [Spongiibacter pelagi]
MTASKTTATARQESPLRIPGYFLSYAEKFLEENGFESLPLWQAASLAKENFNPILDSVSEAQFQQFILAAKSQYGEPSFGFELGRNINITGFGTLSQALVNCENVRDTTQLMSRYSTLAFPLVKFSCFDTDDGFIVEFDTRSHFQNLNSIIVEILLSTLIPSIQFLTGQAIKPVRADIAFTKPTYWARYQNIIADEIYDNSPRNLIYFPSHVADLPLLTANRTNRAVAIEQCELAMEQKGDISDLPERVISQIRSKLAQSPNALDIARSLNMSERTLRRTLAASDASFRDLLKQAREEMAKFYLSNSAMPITLIAGKLGYQETANFRAAFKSWTGYTPGHWRSEFGHAK